MKTYCTMSMSNQMLYSVIIAHIAFSSEVHVNLSIAQNVLEKGSLGYYYIGLLFFTLRKKKFF